MDERHLTPLERPRDLANKPTMTDAEAAAYEKANAEELQKQDGQSDGPLIARQVRPVRAATNVLFVDRGNGASQSPTA